LEGNLRKQSRAGGWYVYLNGQLIAGFKREEYADIFMNAATKTGRGQSV
jgi:hypothetical protein